MNCRECGTAHDGEPAPQWVCEQCGCANWDGVAENMKKVLAVDFDGVIHRYSRGWQDGRIYDIPMEGAIIGMKRLQHANWHLIIFTVREDLKAVKEWMIDWWPTDACIQPDYVDLLVGSNLAKRFVEPPPKEARICNAHPIPQITNRKPGAYAYIDDRAFRFESWGGVWNEFGSNQVPEGSR